LPPRAEGADDRSTSVLTVQRSGWRVVLVAAGTLGNAQEMPAHESPCTTKLYDRTGDEITIDEVERITI
jgi:hypothetical protein